MGRLVELHTPAPLSSILTSLFTYLGHPAAISVATPQNSTASSLSIRRIGICAGSGGSVFGPLEKPDLLITGELVHHEALAAIESGCAVVCFGHSNSERAYLSAVMKGRLEQVLAEEWEVMRKEESGDGLGDEDVKVDVSETDRDPFGFAVLR